MDQYIETDSQDPTNNYFSSQEFSYDNYHYFIYGDNMLSMASYREDDYDQYYSEGIFIQQITTYRWTESSDGITHLETEILKTERPFSDETFKSVDGYFDGNYEIYGSLRDTRFLGQTLERRQIYDGTFAYEVFGQLVPSFDALVEESPINDESLSFSGIGNFYGYNAVLSGEDSGDSFSLNAELTSPPLSTTFELYKYTQDSDLLHNWASQDYLLLSSPLYRNSFLDSGFEEIYGYSYAQMLIDIESGFDPAYSRTTVLNTSSGTLDDAHYNADFQNYGVDPLTGLINDSYLSTISESSDDSYLTQSSVNANYSQINESIALDPQQGAEAIQLMEYQLNYIATAVPDWGVLREGQDSLFQTLWQSQQISI